VRIKQGTVTTVFPLLAAAVLVAMHLVAGRLRFLDVIPRSRWLSIAGGVAVAYVFVRLLPELSAGQEVVRRAISGEVLVGLENHIYVVALFGLVTFYGLERVVRTSQEHRPAAQDAERTTTGPGVFWLHIASFGVYNLLIGYLLLHRIRPGLMSLAFYTIAMALHFLVTDYGLRKDHRRDYDRIGRWALSVALLGGLAAGYLASLPELWIAVLTAFLSGGVILNVLKEELPEERKSHIMPFFIGAFGYAAILLLA
jgi:hypothetical protein